MPLPSSSPPLLPQSSFAELPSSPPLLPTTPSSATLPWIPATRKRQLSEQDCHISSDPLFSDDTSGTEDASRYQRPKRKRMIRGPWWEIANKEGRRGTQDVATPKQKDFSRNVDSGIWMGSDGSEDSTESTSCYPDSMRRLHVTDHSRSLQTPRAAPQQPTPQSIAASIVTGCVENGKQTVDLSDLGLVDIPSSTLKPLHELIRQPLFDASLPPSDDEFGPLTPDIQLFLASNGLTTLPDELFQLENITVLSLRNNALTQLPSDITQLKRLKELNVAGNGIEYLPWELLDILQSRRSRLIVRPNPMLEPMKDFSESSPSPLATQPRSKQDIKLQHCPDARACIDDARTQCAANGTLDMRTELELRLQLGHALWEQHLQMTAALQDQGKRRDELIYLASSAIQYYDVDGRPNSPTLAEHDAPSTHARLEQCEATLSSTRVPSLLELALRVTQQHYDLSHIPDDMPSRVHTVLQMAKTNANNQVCSTCNRSCIITRAQWFEYWHSGSSAKTELTHESVLPFIRRACSWACAVPTAIGTFRA